jgi:hypothetical protein
MDNLQKKYKNVMSQKELRDKLDEFDSKLKEIRQHTIVFADELFTYKDKDQKRLRDFF